MKINPVSKNDTIIRPAAYKHDRRSKFVGVALRGHPFSQCHLLSKGAQMKKEAATECRPYNFYDTSDDLSDE